MAYTRQLLLPFAFLVLVDVPVHGEDRATGDARRPNPFALQRPKTGVNAKSKSLREEADRLRTRAAVLNVRAASLWDRGKYDEADDLEEQANDLTAQQRRLETRAKALEMNPDVPEAELPTLGDGQ